MKWKKDEAKRRPSQKLSLSEDIPGSPSSASPTLQEYAPMEDSKEGVKGNCDVIISNKSRQPDGGGILKEEKELVDFSDLDFNGLATPIENNLSKVKW